jgi:hypothetical protein
MEIAKSRPGLRNLFNKFDDDIRLYFDDLLPLVDSDFSFDIILAYVFFKLEQGQRQALFCGARKLHKTDSELTWLALDKQHVTRETYQRFVQTIFGFEIPKPTLEIIAKAEESRDRLMHGRDVDELEKREAISRVLHYCDQINKLIADDKKLGFKPYKSDLRGFAGALASLDQSTTRWILKGMGFSLS